MYFEPNEIAELESNNGTEITEMNEDDLEVEIENDNDNEEQDKKPPLR